MFWRCSNTCSTPRNSHKVRSEGIIQVFMRQAGGDETLLGVELFLEVTELFVDSWPWNINHHFLCTQCPGGKGRRGTGAFSSSLRVTAEVYRGATFAVRHANDVIRWLRFISSRPKLFAVCSRLPQRALSSQKSLQALSLSLPWVWTCLSTRWWACRGNTLRPECPLIPRLSTKTQGVLSTPLAGPTLTLAVTECTLEGKWHFISRII